MNRGARIVVAGGAMALKDAVGRFGERLAERRLRERGWEVLATNWRCALGELDLVAVDGRDAVFVEVKTRRSEAYGGAVAAVTPAKLRRLRLLAGAWLASQDRAFDGARIDVVAVTLPRSGPPVVEHLRDVG
ncbi:YraN family protein [Demequina lignilytica]